MLVLPLALKVEILLTFVVRAQDPKFSLPIHDTTLLKMNSKREHWSLKHTRVDPAFICFTALLFKDQQCTIPHYQVM